MWLGWKQEGKDLKRVLKKALLLAPKKSAGLCSQFDIVVKLCNCDITSCYWTIKDVSA